MSDAIVQPASTARRYRFSPVAALVAGVLVVPIVLSAVFTSYGPPDAAAYVRMAFASVAGVVVAIATTVGVVLERFVHRHRDAVPFAVLGAFVVTWQTSLLSSIATTLLERLG